MIIEDDPVLGMALQKGIGESSHECAWIKDGRRGFEQAMSQRFDVIVLDLMIPGMPGMVLLEELRKQGIRTPVIIVSALGTLNDRIQGLQAGADDYLSKPFAMPELMARIEAVCRRAAIKPSAVIQIGELTLDLARRRVSRGDLEVELVCTEYSIFKLLMFHAGRVVTRKMLCEILWESDWDGATNAIEVHINRLRGKLLRIHGENLIHTVRGRGYALRVT